MAKSIFIIDTSPEDPTPVYHQLEKAIQDRIENGRLTVDDPIPPERDIAKINGLSLATVRRALQNLVQNGFLHRIQGKGTFVSNTALRRKDIRYYPLVNNFQDDIRKVYIKLIEIQRIKGKRQINQYLQIRSNQDVYELRRVISQNRNPIIYSVSYLPYNMFEGLENYKTLYFEKYPLYIFLEQKFSVSTMKNRELYGATLADKNLAKILNVQEGNPLLLVKMQALTHKDKPYEYRISYCYTEEKKIRRIL
jgi:GntR family transcriptional regulator, N-acetylglucosamine utilization regulator